MDECDVSDLRNEFEDKLRMDNHRKLMANKNVEEDCVECGDLISKARQDATGGTDICVQCLELEEIKNKQYRGRL